MKKIFTLTCAAIVLTMSAQEHEAPDYGDFTIDAQLRARGEFRTGQGTLDEESPNPHLFVNDRVRLSLGWERRNLSMKVAAQHTGTWQDDGARNTKGNIALHEAWAKMTFGRGFFAQVGRQELVYDDERIFGAFDWAPTGRAHDALRLGWGNWCHQLHAIASFNQTADAPDGLKLYKNMQTLWYHFGSAARPFGMSLLFSNQGVSDVSGGTSYMQTVGTRMTYARRRFSADASFYYQTGYDRTGADVGAFMASGNIGLQCSPKWRLSIGDEYLSGSDGMPGSNSTFNPLYGTHHKFLGSMDFFTYGSIPLYGLNDVHAGASFRGSPKFDMSMAAHWFMTGRPINNFLKNPTEELTDPAKISIMRRYNGKYRFGQHLGTEIDFELSYRPWQYVALKAGYSMMIASETMQLFKGDDQSTVHNWGWVSFDLTPTVFSTRHRK